MKYCQCLCGAYDCLRCYPGRPRCAGCGRIDCEDEDCFDKRLEAEEAKAEARAEAREHERHHIEANGWMGDDE